DIDDLHRKLTRGTDTQRGVPIKANRTVALLRSMFAQAIRWGWLKENPTKGIKFNRENRRERYLKPDELVRLLEALAAYHNQEAANVIRLLLLTGARRGEVMNAEWSQFDLEAATWSKPATATKQGKSHTVPLSAPALELLTRMRAT